MRERFGGVVGVGKGGGTGHRVQQVLCREAERNRPRPRIQRLPATHLKLIECTRSNQGNTVIVLLLCHIRLH